MLSVDRMNHSTDKNYFHIISLKKAQNQLDQTN